MRLRSDLGFTLGGRVLGTIAGFLILSLIGHSAGAAELGRYAVWTSLAVPWSVAGTLGLGRLALRDPNSLHGRPATMLLLIGSVLGAVGAGLSVWLGGSEPLVAVLLAVYTMAVSILQSLSAKLRVSNQIRTAAAVGGLNGGASVTLLALVGTALLALGSNLDAVAALGALSLSSVVVCAATWARTGAPVDCGSSIPGVTQLLSGGLPFLVTAVVGNLPVDLWVAADLFDADTLGRYAAARRLLAVSGIVLQAANTSLSPRIAKVTRGRELPLPEDEARQLEFPLRQAATVGALPTVLLVAFTGTAPSFVFGLMFGPTFEDSGAIFRLMAIGALANAVSGACGSMLSMTGHEKKVLVVTALSYGFGAAVGYVCGPEALGPAIGYSVALLSRYAVMSAQSVSATGMRPWILGNPVSRPSRGRALT